MTVKYTIEAPDEYSADIWKLLTEKFNVTLNKRQHSVDGKILYIDTKITDIKQPKYKEKECGN